jgi:branched-chain amino acid transport system permease protein
MSRPASGGNAILNLGVLALVVAASAADDDNAVLRPGSHRRRDVGRTRAVLNVICGYAGYISFGHVAFFGIGAYTTAIPDAARHA